MEQITPARDLPLWGQASGKLPEEGKNVFQSSKASKLGFLDIVRMSEESESAFQENR